MSVSSRRQRWSVLLTFYPRTQHRAWPLLSAPGYVKGTLGVIRTAKVTLSLAAWAPQSAQCSPADSLSRGCPSAPSLSFRVERGQQVWPWEDTPSPRALLLLKPSSVGPRVAAEPEDILGSAVQGRFVGSQSQVP